MKNHRSDILFLVAVVLTLWIAWTVRDVLLLIYVSALFAVVLSPVVALVRKINIRGWHPGRGFAIVFLMLMLVLAATVFIVFALPPIYGEARQFAADWPRHLVAASDELHHLPLGVKIDPNGLEKYAAEIVGGAGGLFLNLAGGIFGLFTGIILMAYFIIDGENAFRWSISLFPANQQQRLASTLMRAQNRMRKWLVGQMVLMASFGACSLVVYYALGLKYFYVLAMYAGIANIVPIAGPISAVLIACTVALLDSPHKLLGVLVFYAVYAQFESGFLSPRIMRSTLKLSPIAVIIALALGGSLAGVLGALVSVPTAALVLVFADEYLVKRKQAGAAAAAAD